MLADKKTAEYDDTNIYMILKPRELVIKRFKFPFSGGLLPLLLSHLSQVLISEHFADLTMINLSYVGDDGVEAI